MSSCSSIAHALSADTMFAMIEPKLNATSFVVDSKKLSVNVGVFANIHKFFVSAVAENTSNEVDLVFSDKNFIVFRRRFMSKHFFCLVFVLLLYKLFLMIQYLDAVWK